MNLSSRSLRTIICLTHVFLFLVSLTVLSGCSRTKAKPRKSADADAGDATPSSDALRILAQKGYLGENVVKKAEEEGMVKIIMDTFTTDEEFNKKWKDGLGGYDIVYPSQGMLAHLLDGELATPLDKKQIENLKHLDPKLLGVLNDKENKFTVPMMFQPLMAMGVRTDLVKKPVKGLDSLFDEEYKGKIGITDNPGMIIATFLMHQGHQPNLEGDNPAKVKDLLLKLRPFVKEFSADSLLDKLKKGEVWIVLDLYGNLAGVNPEEDKNLRVFVPETGSPLYVESLCVAKEAPNPELAFWFIDYLFREDIALMNMEETGMATGSLAARAKLKPEERANTLVFPPAPAKAKNLSDWMFQEPADAQKLEPLWKEIKGAK